MQDYTGMFEKVAKRSVQESLLHYTNTLGRTMPKQYGKVDFRDPSKLDNWQKHLVRGIGAVESRAMKMSDKRFAAFDKRSIKDRVKMKDAFDESLRSGLLENKNLSDAQKHSIMRRAYKEIRF